MGERRINHDFADWLKRRMRTAGIATPTDLARASGVDQSTISRWLNEGRDPTIDNLRQIAGPLNATMLELLVAAGYVGPDELGDLPADATVGDVAEAIRRDTDLLEEARQHLLNQYELLRRLSPLSDQTDTKRPAKTPPPQKPLRAVARRRPPRKEKP